MEINARTGTTLYMTQHARIPAIAAIVLTLLAGLGLLAATGQFHKTDLTHASLEELEKQALVSTDGRVWVAYGDKLRDLDRFASAAKAYQRALELQPDLTDARLAEIAAAGAAAAAVAGAAAAAPLAGAAALASPAATAPSAPSSSFFLPMTSGSVGPASTATAITSSFTVATGLWYCLVRFT